MKTKSRRIVSFVLLGLLLGGGAVWKARRPRHQPAPALADDPAPGGTEPRVGEPGPMVSWEQRLEALARAQAALALRYEVLVRRLEELQAGAGASHRSRDEHGENDPQDGPMAAELKAQRRATLDQTFAGEARDPNWTPIAESEITEAVRRASPADPTVIAAQCRNTVCRLELKVDRERASDLFEGVVAALSWDMDAFLAPSDNGSVAYLSRNAHRLPHPGRHAAP